MLHGDGPFLDVHTAVHMLHGPLAVHNIHGLHGPLAVHNVHELHGPAFAVHTVMDIID